MINSFSDLPALSESNLHPQHLTMATYAFSAASADLSAAAGWASKDTTEVTIDMLVEAQRRHDAWRWGTASPEGAPAASSSGDDSAAEPTDDSSSSCADHADSAELLLIDLFDCTEAEELGDELFGDLSLLEGDDGGSLFGDLTDDDGGSGLTGDAELAEPAADAAYATLCRLFGEEDADLAAVLATGALSAEDAQLLPAAFRPAPATPQPASRVTTRSMSRKAAAAAHTRTHTMLTRSQAKAMKAPATAV